MQTVVQWVRTSWTKQSRGGAEASRRNAAPTAFLLPTVRPQFTHEVRMDERDDFQPQFAIKDGLPDSASPSGVLLHEANGLLRVQLTVTPYGTPRRWRRPPAQRLAPGEWLRWQINYRFTRECGGEWTYLLDTLNIALCPARTDLFLGTPTRHVNELATLR